MKGLIAAIRWLTILPTPASQQEDHGRALFWLPVIGALVGLFVWMAALSGSFVDAWLGALLGVIVWVGITGFLHVDGLADLADAMGAAHGDRSRFVEVLKDSHIGSFGVMSLLLLVVSKLILLKLLIGLDELWLLILIPAWARLGASWWALSLPSLTDGSAKAWVEDASQKQAVWWGVALVFMTIFFASGSWLLLIAPVLLWVWYLFLQKKIGGVNGDCLGAGIEVCEVGMLLLLVVTHAI
ncbi:MAG: adenosylcobinamide-GDP ribazoletransferase [Mariprofundaceae bacterium]